MLASRPLRLPLLIAAFLQRWPSAPQAEHWSVRWDCDFRQIKNVPSEITRVGITSAHGERCKISCTALFAGLRLVVVAKSTRLPANSMGLLRAPRLQRFATCEFLGAINAVL